MRRKFLIILLALAPLVAFCQGKNKISFGAGMVSDLFTDQNLSSLVYAGSGFDMGLSYERILNEKMYFRGGFALQTSELTHEIDLQPIGSFFSGMDVMLYRQLFLKNNQRLSMGLGYSGAFEARTREYGDLSQVEERRQGLVIGPEYQFDRGNLLLRFSMSVPVLSRIYTQAHVGNGAHEFFLASVHNYLSVETLSGLFFRIAPSQYVGMEYGWQFRNNEVAKTINKATHAVRVSYLFHF